TGNTLQSGVPTSSSHARPPVPPVEPPVPPVAPPVPPVVPALPPVVPALPPVVPALPPVVPALPPLLPALPPLPAVPPLAPEPPQPLVPPVSPSSLFCTTQADVASAPTSNKALVLSINIVVIPPSNALIHAMILCVVAAGLGARRPPWSDCRKRSPTDCIRRVELSPSPIADYLRFDAPSKGLGSDGASVQVGSRGYFRAGFSAEGREALGPTPPLRAG